MGASGGVVLDRRYVLGEKVGAGGFSEVWRATDLVLARPVAIKLLHLGDAEALTRFRAEAQHAGRLSHQNIARIYDYGEPAPPQPPFLVMELVDGPSLAGALAAGPLGTARCLEIVAQIASGLHAAHLMGLVHRDIKPANLLLAPGGIVKITDFGIARAADSAPVTVTGQLIGTPGYLAPERVMGASATAASDLYSLGIVAYECLAGAPPFTGPALAVAMAHRERLLPPLPGPVPADIAELVLELTAKDPADRPSSAGAVARRAGQMAALLAAGAASAAGPPYRDPAVTRAEQTARYPEAVPLAGPDRDVAAPPPGLDPGHGAQVPALVPVTEQATHNVHARPPMVARQSRARRALRRTVLPAVAAVMVLAAAFLIGSAIDPGPAPHADTVPSATPSGPFQPGTAQAATVEVRAGQLIGLPVTTAVHRLHHLGLSVRVVWRRSHAQPPGTVLAVLPTGRRPPGSTVVLTGAHAARHGHRGGGDQRDGGDHGDHHGAGDSGDQHGGGGNGDQQSGSDQQIGGDQQSASRGTSEGQHTNAPAGGSAVSDGVLSTLALPAAS